MGRVSTPTGTDGTSCSAGKKRSCLPYICFNRRDCLVNEVSLPGLTVATNIRVLADTHRMHVPVEMLVQSQVSGR